ncbi:BRCT domain-containing protein At4g02110 [Lotus japonicus]|uniref:BRCT domain-containing protein At4g02110 n=1 Tax=Lotus japonicus TaxID=34305 RepID=UPI00258DB0D6|nr:BRCT domain-containing protein At4g02110 [Lotus japonicus]
MLQTSNPSRVFRGVHFVLIGFDPVTESKIRFKLVNGGGVDVGQYSGRCTHVIVDNIAYDDPVCVAARRDGKTLVTALWVEHSADVGMTVDSASVMYRPPKDLNGIPGANELIMCLTGYLRQDRDDIMTMVGLMGAQFSKPLVANKVTHLICYKFEGEKYELAKKMGTIKLVNHRWLEDCLKDWVLLPEDKYNKSGFELEMVEEAKDSEDEAEASKLEQSGGRDRNKSPLSSKLGIAAIHGSSKSVRETSNLVSDSTGVQVLPNVNKVTESSPSPRKKNRSDQDLGLHNVDDPKISCKASDVSLHSTSYQLPETFVNINESKKADFPEELKREEFCNIGNTNQSGQQPDLRDHSSESKKSVRDVRSTSANAEGLVHSEEKPSAMSSSRKNQKRFARPRNLDDCSGREGSSHETSFTEVEKASGGIKSTSVKGSRKGNDFIKGDEPTSLLPQKRINEASSAKLKSRKVSTDTKLSVERVPLTNGKSEGLKVTSAVDESISRNASSESAQCDNVHQNSPQMVVQSSSKSKVNSEPDITAFGTGQDADEVGKLNVTKDKCCPSPGNKMLLNEESAGIDNLDINNEESNKPRKKSPRKKSVAKRSWGSKPKTGVAAKLKTSASLNKTTTQGGGIEFSCGGKEVAKLKTSASLNKTTTQGGGIEFSSGGKEVATCGPQKHEASPQILDANKLKEQETAGNYAEDAGVRTEFLDDETEAPDDKCENLFGLSLDEDSVHLSKKEDTSAEEKSEVIHGKKSEEAMPPKKSTNEAEKQNLTSPVDSISKSKVKHQARKRPAGKTKKATVAKDLSKSGKAVSEENIPNGTRDEAQIEIEEEIFLTADVSDNSTVLRNKSENSIEDEKENRPIDKEQDVMGGRKVGNKSSVKPAKINSKKMGLNPSISESKARAITEARCFILSGHRLQRKEFQQVIKRLKGRVCRDSHQWSYQATHFIAPDPLRRTEKFFAAAASGRWILTTDFLTASSQAGKLLPEEPYEWHKTGLNEDGAINMEAPRKWRLLRERTGHGAFYGMRIVVYGDCITPPLDTLKRVVKAGDGTILATSPPYTRFLGTGIDYAIISPGMPRVDIWVQEFLKHEIPCIVADYLVEYVCKPGFPLERHVLYGTNTWAERSYANLQSRAEEVLEEVIPEDFSAGDIPCQVCGSRDRGDVMLICGDESGSLGCGIGTHIDCCDPPLPEVPEEDWFCPKCSSTQNWSNNPAKKKKRALSLSKSK